jgi:hypothetical protein
MGTILQAICSSCNYRSRNILFGGGMKSFKTVCSFPVLNNDTNEVGSRNIMTKEAILKKNENLIFYDSADLINSENIINDDIHQFGKYFVYTGDIYKCPKCREYKMGFYSFGCWD